MSRKKIKKTCTKKTKDQGFVLPKRVSDNLGAALSRAQQHLQEGRLDQLEATCRAILTATPEQPEALHLLGVSAFHRGNFQLAGDYLQRAVALRPHSVELHCNLGLILSHSTTNLDRAIEHCRMAIALKPDYPEAYNNLGNALRIRKDLQEALTCFEKALAMNPQYAEAYCNQGTAFQEQGNPLRAVECYNAALQWKPDFFEAYYNLGNAYRDMGRPGDAVAAYEKSLRLNPNFPDVYNNLGNAVMAQGSIDQAMEYFRKALAIHPGHPETLCSLGYAFMVQGKWGEAVRSYQAALKWKPDFADAWNNLGNAFKGGAQSVDAIAAYQKALQLDPNCSQAHNNLGTILNELGCHDESLGSLRRALACKPTCAGAYSNLLLNLHYPAGFDGQTIFAEHCKWGSQYLAAGPCPGAACTNDPSPHRRLRIGYVSADFRQQSVAFFVEPLLAAHNRQEFEVFCYSNVRWPDRWTRRLQELPDAWRDISALSDEKAAGLIRTDGIDILIDLSGHTACNRLSLFALKPAPVQVTYIGYPDTTGLAAMDYRLTDSWADPPGTTEHLHVERLVRLPQGFLCYQPPGQAPEVGEPPFLKQGYVTFGSFNNRPKITPQVVVLWAKILQKLPESRLILKAWALRDRQACRYLEDLFAQQGIAADRLDLLGFAPSLEEHLNLYGQVDIALDTFPYNGTTTTCEALWMGVPVIVLTGDRHVSRVGVSLLSRLELTDLIAESTDRYLAKAVQLALDPQRLCHLRHNLRSVMRDSKLTDAEFFTAALESAYRDMWRKWCAGRQQPQTASSSKRHWESGDSVVIQNSVRQQAAVHNEQGERLFHEGLTDSALRAFQQAIEIDPDYVDPYNNMGILLWHCGEVQQALEWLTQACRVDPHHETTLNNLQAILQQLGGKDGAVRTAEQ